jgi:hypothetical protein
MSIRYADHNQVVAKAANTQEKEKEKEKEIVEEGVEV